MLENDQDGVLDNMEKGSAPNGGMTELIPEDGMHYCTKLWITTLNLQKDLFSLVFFFFWVLCSSSDSKTTTTFKSPSVSTVSPNRVKLKKERRHIPSASTALVIGAFLGIFQTIFLIFTAKPLLSFMGVKSVSLSAHNYEY